MAKKKKITLSREFYERHEWIQSKAAEGLEAHSEDARAGLAAAGLGRQQPPEHERQDAAVAQVLALARRVQSDARAELESVRPHRHLARLAVLDTGDRECLPAGQAE